MTQKNSFAIMIMIWVTLLTIWAVNKVTNTLIDTNSGSVSVSGIPYPPEPQQYSTVQIDKNTVWVIDPNNTVLTIIKHDEDGYHMTTEEMYTGQ